MFRKVLAFFLVVISLSSLSANFIYADSQDEKQARFVAKVKRDIAKLGTGKDARIKVKLQDNSNIEGYISAFDDQTFTVINFKTGDAKKISYSDVKSIKGKNLSTKVKIAIGVGVGVVIFVLWFYFAIYDD